VRLRNGDVRVLDAPHPSYERHAPTTLDVASGRIFIGQDSTDATVRWDLGAPHGGGPIEGDVVARYHNHPARGFADAAGIDGAYVSGIDVRHRVFHTSDERRFAMPAEYYRRSEAINANGVVAFTAKHDRLVHLMSCS
jgi:hypothetical protein